MTCFASLSGCFGGSQLGLKAPKRFTYFALATPVGLPSQLLLEITGARCEEISIQMDQWAELKPKTPNGQLPYAELPDGTFVFESGAIGRTIAGAGGLLGAGKDFMMSEQLVGMTADLNKHVMSHAPTVFTVKDFTSEKKQAFAHSKTGVFDFVKKYEKLLLPKGDRFTKSGLSFGEVDLFSKLHCYANGPYPEVATGPLAKFYKRMSEVPGVKKVLNGESKFGKLQTYLIPVEN